MGITPDNAFDTETVDLLKRECGGDARLLQDYHHPFHRCDDTLRREGVRWRMTDDEMRQVLEGRRFEDWLRITGNAMHCGFDAAARRVDGHRRQKHMFSQRWGEHHFLACYLVWRSYYTPQWRGVVAAGSVERASSVLGLVQDKYRALPFHMKHGLTAWSSKRLGFENGSAVTVTSLSATSTVNCDFLLLRDAHYWTASQWDRGLPRLMMGLGAAGSVMMTSTVDESPGRFEEAWGEDDWSCAKWDVHTTCVDEVDATCAASSGEWERCYLLRRG